MSSTDMEFRTLHPEAIDAVMRLERSLPDVPYWITSEQSEQMTIIDNGVMFGVFEDNTLIGKVGFIEISPGEWEVDGMIVDQQCRGKSYGKKLLSYALDRLKESHRPEMLTLFTYPGNSAAVRLYLSHGFTIVDWIPDKYGPGKHRLKLTRKESRP